MRGSTMSSAKSVWPVTLAAASTLGNGWPTTRRSRRVSSGTNGLLDLVPHPRRRELDRFEYLQVPRAATEVAGEGLRDLGSGRAGVLAGHPLRHEHEPRRAVPTLPGPAREQGLLQRAEHASRGQAP